MHRYTYISHGCEKGAESDQQGALGRTLIMQPMFESRLPLAKVQKQKVPH